MKFMSLLSEGDDCLVPTQTRYFVKKFPTSTTRVILSKMQSEPTWWLITLIINVETKEPNRIEKIISKLGYSCNEIQHSPSQFTLDVFFIESVRIVL